MVKCTTCSMATRKPTILALKIAMLQQHQGNYTTEKDMPNGVKKGEKYLSQYYWHLKNERTLATRATRPINEAVQDMVGGKQESSSKWGWYFTSSILDNWWWTTHLYAPCCNFLESQSLQSVTGVMVRSGCSPNACFNKLRLKPWRLWDLPSLSHFLAMKLYLSTMDLGLVSIAMWFRIGVEFLYS